MPWERGRVWVWDRRCLSGARRRSTCLSHLARRPLPTSLVNESRLASVQRNASSVPYPHPPSLPRHASPSPLNPPVRPNIPAETNTYKNTQTPTPHTTSVPPHSLPPPEDTPSVAPSSIAEFNIDLQIDSPKCCLRYLSST